MKLSRSAYILAIIIINIILDQVSKIIVRQYVPYRQDSNIIGDYFILTNVENEGAFLGMGSDFDPTVKLILLIILPVLVLGYVTYYIFKTKELDKYSLFGFSCIIGGGTANLFDRIVFGSVTDFLHIDLGGVFKTGIFNVADMAVMLGLGLLIYSGFLNSKKNVQKKATH